VLVEVVDQDDGVHGVVQECVVVPIAGRVQLAGGLPAALVVPLADGHHLHPGLSCEARQGGAAAQSEHADANGPPHRPAPCNDDATA
jgi:hypothetical protein